VNLLENSSSSLFAYTDWADVKDIPHRDSGTDTVKIPRKYGVIDCTNQILLLKALLQQANNSECYRYYSTIVLYYGDFVTLN
jgi:hypothetical protein